MPDSAAWQTCCLRHKTWSAWTQCQQAKGIGHTSPGSQNLGSVVTAHALTAGTLSSRRSSMVSSSLSRSSPSASSADMLRKTTATSWQHRKRTVLSLTVTRLINHLSSFSAKASHSASLLGSRVAMKPAIKPMIRPALCEPCGATRG